VTARVHIVDRIITAIAVQIQAVNTLCIEVGGAVGGDEAAPLRAIVSSVAIVQAGIVIVVRATGMKMGVLATTTSAYLFYHFPRQQSRKTTQAAMTRVVKLFLIK
jgi:hypothetical protein